MCGRWVPLCFINNLKIKLHQLSMWHIKSHKLSLCFFLFMYMVGMVFKTHVVGLFSYTVTFQLLNSLMYPHIWGNLVFSSIKPYHFPLKKPLTPLLQPLIEPPEIDDLISSIKRPKWNPKLEFTTHYSSKYR